MKLDIRAEACPSCGARPGEPCVTGAFIASGYAARYGIHGKGAGRRTNNHKRRVGAAIWRASQAEGSK